MLIDVLQHVEESSPLVEYRVNRHVRIIRIACQSLLNVLSFGFQLLDLASDFRLNGC